MGIIPIMTATAEDPAHAARIREMLHEELDAEWLYLRLAAITRDATTATTLRELAQAERRHARHWAERLGEPARLETAHSPSWRPRVLAALARVAGIGAVLPQLRAAELADIRRYEAEPGASALAAEEREHRATLSDLTQAGRVDEAEHGLGTAAAGVFRAIIFGFNDGLVSNLSLVAGVAGATIAGDTVLIAGVVGLLAGSFSMAAGEYVSVRSQRELYEHQIAMEREELELAPEEERAELVQIYMRKGVSEQVSRELVDTLMADPARALDTLAREELGLNPADLGSPWGSAIGSYLAFTLGAFVPVLPFIVGGGYWALAAAIIGGMVMLALVGALSSLLTGRSALFAGGRMVLIGLGATGVTFGIGSALPFD